MIISDLNYLEVVTEASVIGGLGAPITIVPGVNIAVGGAESTALGGTTFTSTSVVTQSAAGVGSSSKSAGVSVAAP